MMDLPDESFTEDEDFALMRSVGRGDEAAFEKLIERHQLRVIGTIAKMLGNFEGAEDLGQQVFLRVWNSAPRYQATAKFTTWLLTIVRNLVFNEVRRRQRAQWLPMEHSDGTPREFLDPNARTGAQQCERSEMSEAVDRAIASLPEAQRIAIILRRYEELPYEDIAEVLKTTIPSVKSLLFRAREELRLKLAPFLSEE
jgi:RNA polymerase sigma-70 factor (ECF subfamily)